MKRILFQGDSITDAGRIAEDLYEPEKGYAFFGKGAYAL